MEDGKLICQTKKTFLDFMLDAGWELVMGHKLNQLTKKIIRRLINNLKFWWTFSDILDPEQAKIKS